MILLPKAPLDSDFWVETKSHTLHLQEIQDVLYNVYVIPTL